MNVQRTLIELGHWHSIIRPDIDDDDYLALYRKLADSELKELEAAESIGSVVKEMCDVIVVCYPLITYGTEEDQCKYYKISQDMCRALRDSDVPWWVAVSRVNKANMSKFVRAHEVNATQNMFEKRGVEVDIRYIEPDVFGVYSTKDQTVDGYFYEKDKLLKGPAYFEIDESVEWWK